MQGNHTTRRDFLRRCALLGFGSLAAACSAAPPVAPSVAPTVQLHDAAQTAVPTAVSVTPSPVQKTARDDTTGRNRPTPGPQSFREIGSREALIARAQSEGTLVVSGLPHDWLSYDLVLDSFSAQYGIDVVELTPNATGSQVVGQLAGSATAPDAAVPDVVDLGASIGLRAVEQNLLQPYAHEQWDDITAELRHPSGYWSSAYQGIIAMAVNKAAVAQTPKQWTDLVSPVYRGQFALTGDPTSSPQAFHSVYATSLALATALDDGTAALAFFAQLRDGGILQQVTATTATFLSGDTPIIPVWSYTAHALQAQAGSNPLVELVLPTPGLAGLFVHGINAYAAHPYAARLWIEHLFSDDIQMRFASAYALPTRVSALATNATYSGLLDTLGFNAAVRSAVVVPSAAQLSSARATLTREWATTMNQPATP